jgi:hypothetical protein
VATTQKESSNKKEEEAPLMNLATEIIESIKVQRFSEDICANVEKVVANNSPLGALIFEKLLEFNWSEISDDATMVVLFNYVHKFLQIYGHEKIRRWHSLIFEHLHSRNLELINTLKKLTHDLILLDNGLRDSFLDYYFKLHQQGLTPSKSTEILTFALVSYAEQKPVVI